MQLWIRHCVSTFSLCLGLVALQPVLADKRGETHSDQSAKQPAVANDMMTNQRLGQLINRLDKDARGGDGMWQFSIESVDVTVITDENADRMRIISPVAKGEDLDKDMLYRLMQSNFDSALDARYSIAKGVLWSTFIHPLGSLGDEEFLSALGQVVNLSLSYGTSFSSGALIFRGGDSAEIQQRELIDRLIEEGLAI
jgi:hypothetical protein